MARAIQFLFGQYVPRCTHRVDKQFDYCVLQYMNGGAVRLDVADQTHHLEGRQFFSSYPGPRIRFHAEGGTWVHRYLAFRGPIVNRWIKAKLFPIAPQRPPGNADYARQFDDLLELTRRTDHWGAARATLLLETILTELAEARSRQHVTPNWLESGLAQMTALGTQVDHEELASEAGLSSRTFRRRFARAMNTSPRAYAIACRIGHAKQMLGATDLPIKSVAEQLGYRDVFYFTRQFTHVTGVSPAAYRRSKES